MSVSALRLLTGVDAPAAGGPAQPRAEYTPVETVLVMTAGLVFVDGLIHVGAAIDHYGDYHLYTLAFSLIAVLQFTWAGMLLRRPSRSVILAGVLFQLAVVALWIASRSVGVPIAPSPWVPEGVGVADLVATIGECITVLAALAVLGRERNALASWLVPRLAPLVLVAVLTSALFGTVPHAG